MSVEKRKKWHVCGIVLRYISYAKCLQILEVLRDFHRLFGSRNSPTTGILHTVRHVYWSVWPAREAKPRFGCSLERSAHDSVWNSLITRPFSLLEKMKRTIFNVPGVVKAMPFIAERVFTKSCIMTTIRCTRVI